MKVNETMMKVNLTGKTRVVHIESDIAITEFEDGLVMLDIEKSNYYNLNKVASEIWKQLKTPILIDEIAINISNKFDCSSEECYADIINFLLQLHNQSLLKIVD